MPDATTPGSKSVGKLTQRISGKSVNAGGMKISESSTAAVISSNAKKDLKLSPATGQKVDVSSDLSVSGKTSLATTAQMTAGAGITAVATAKVKYSVIRVGDITETKIFVDLTGLNSNSAGDIIGKDATDDCHIGKITAAVNGTIIDGTVQCLETPGGGEPDIDLFSATASNGAEDVAISTLDETEILATAADLTAGTVKGITGTIAADNYLYLVGSGAGTNAAYTAGQLLITLYSI